MADDEINRPMQNASSFCALKAQKNNNKRNVIRETTRGIRDNGTYKRIKNLHQFRIHFESFRLLFFLKATQFYDISACNYSGNFSCETHFVVFFFFR